MYVASRIWQLPHKFMPQDKLTSASCNALLPHFPLVLHDLAALQREEPELSQLSEKLCMKKYLSFLYLKRLCTVHLDWIAGEKLSCQQTWFQRFPNIITPHLWVDN
jgi:hypothetical protein